MQILQQIDLRRKLMKGNALASPMETISSDYGGRNEHVRKAKTIRGN